VQFSDEYSDEYSTVTSLEYRRLHSSDEYGDQYSDGFSSVIGTVSDEYKECSS
jgi:hypothetical protein